MSRSWRIALCAILTVGLLGCSTRPLSDRDGAPAPDTTMDLGGDPGADREVSNEDLGPDLSVPSDVPAPDEIIGGDLQSGDTACMPSKANPPVECPYGVSDPCPSCCFPTGGYRYNKTKGCLEAAWIWQSCAYGFQGGAPEGTCVMNLETGEQYWSSAALGSLPGWGPCDFKNKEDRYNPPPSCETP